MNMNYGVFFFGLCVHEEYSLAFCMRFQMAKIMRQPFAIRIEQANVHQGCMFNS